MLDENAQWLSAKQTARHIAALNSTLNQAALSDEWEIAFLNAFSKLGTVVHEPDRVGESKPDIILRINGTKVLVADIVTASDKDLHRINPVETLWDELWNRTKRVRDAGISTGFSLQVGAGTPKRGQSLFRGRGAQPVRLKIPEQQRWKAVIFNRGFERFLSAVVSRPAVDREFVVRSDEADIRIGYGLNESWRREHLVYTGTPFKKKNPVHTALRHKRDQLAKSKFTGTKGIILCDGYCALMQDRSGSWASFGLDEVVKEFLREHQSISFVAAITISGRRGIGPKNLYYDFTVYTNRRGTPIPAELDKAIMKLPDLLPRPMNTPQNALNELDWLRKTNAWNQGMSHAGGYSLSSRRVKVSSRNVLQLLAGTLGVQQFQAGLGGRNPFAEKLLRGQLIKSVLIEPSEVAEEDDDWIVFEFGEPDPAISPFRQRP